MYIQNISVLWGGGKKAWLMSRYQQRVYKNQAVFFFFFFGLFVWVVYILSVANIYTVAITANNKAVVAADAARSCVCGIQLLVTALPRPKKKRPNSQSKSKYLRILFQLMGN